MTPLNGIPVAEHIMAQFPRNNACLAVCLVGNDKSSEIYVNRKQKACDRAGIQSVIRKFPEDTTEEEIIRWLDKADEEVDGILVQLPLPSHLNRNNILQRINPLKDVDCHHPENQGLLLSDSPRFIPCTPQGILETLKYYKIPVKSKHCVIINNGIVVGLPLAILLSREATVTICNKDTKNLPEITREADILVTAVGKENFRVTGEMIKFESVVIDVGVYRTETGIRGDVIREEVEKRAAWLTPHHGGVGPVTIACLLKNTNKAKILSET